MSFSSHRVLLASCQVPGGWACWQACLCPCLCGVLGSVPHKVNTLNLTVCSFFYLLVIDDQELLIGRLHQLSRLSVERLCSSVIPSYSPEAAKNSRGSAAKRHLAEIHWEAACGLSIIHL